MQGFACLLVQKNFKIYIEPRLILCVLRQLGKGPLFWCCNISKITVDFVAATLQNGITVCVDRNYLYVLETKITAIFLKFLREKTFPFKKTKNSRPIHIFHKIESSNFARTNTAF